MTALLVCLFVMLLVLHLATKTFVGFSQEEQQQKKPNLRCLPHLHHHGT